MQKYHKLLICAALATLAFVIVGCSSGDKDTAPPVDPSKNQAISSQKSEESQAAPAAKE